MNATQFAAHLYVSMAARNRPNAELDQEEIV
jgi:hypothetical protein